MKNDPLAGFTQVITGKQTVRRPQVKGPQEGTVLAVDTGSAEAWFSLPKFSPNFRFGPAPYGRTDDPPQVGDRCLVVFVGAGIAKPWLIRWAAPS